MSRTSPPASASPQARPPHGRERGALREFRQRIGVRGEQRAGEEDRQVGEELDVAQRAIHRPGRLAMAITSHHLRFRRSAPNANSGRAREKIISQRSVHNGLLTGVARAAKMSSACSERRPQRRIGDAPHGHPRTPVALLRLPRDQDARHAANRDRRDDRQIQSHAAAEVVGDSSRSSVALSTGAHERRRCSTKKTQHRFKARAEQLQAG